MSMLNSFRYERPESFEKLSEILATASTSPQYLAGGTDLIVDLRTGKKNPGLVIDIKGLPGLSGIQSTEDGTLWIGALTPIHSLEIESSVQNWATALFEGAQNLGSWQVRNRGTIGGNLGNAAPTADTAAPLLALGAEILTWTPHGIRRIPAASFWRGAGKPNLEPGEVITGVEIPVKTDFSSAYIKLGPRKAMDIAIASAAAMVKVEDGIIVEVAIALGGAASTPIRARQAEEFLTSRQATIENFAEAGSLAVKESNPRSSSRASKEYRLSVIPVLVERAIRTACERQAVLQQGIRG